MEKTVAVFDLEGTLFKRSNSFMSELHNISKRGAVHKAKGALFNISLMMIFMGYKMRLVSELAMRTITIKRMATLLKDFKVGDVEKRAGVFAANYMRLLQPETSKILKEHIMKGRTTILFSGMLQPYVEAVKQELGFDVAMGTELTIKDGSYTGELARAPYFAGRRAEALDEVISKLDYKVNMAKSFAYGDAIFDRYFMGMVGSPVAVYPDKKLAAYAHKHGWSVIT